jgi:glycerophosphoryl diester phosphodiesterase
MFLKFWRKKEKTFSEPVEKDELLTGKKSKNRRTVLVYTGNGASSQNYETVFKKNRLEGKVYKQLGGAYNFAAAQYVTDEKSAIIRNGFTHDSATFVGFVARKKQDNVWKWLCVDGKWHEAAKEMPDKRIFYEGEQLKFLNSLTNYTIILDAQWKNKNGDWVNCGYQMFSNQLMAHALGGYNGKAYNNTMPALKNAVKNGYKYFEVDFSYTSDERLVLCHGWDEIDCKKMGIDYYPEIKNITYDEAMKLIVHGNKIMDVRQFYQFVKANPPYTFEIDLHGFTGIEIQKRVLSLVEDFQHDEEALDRLLIQASSRKMFEDIDSVYHFKHCQYLFGNNVHKLDNNITYALDHGICVLALRVNLAKPEYVKKIRNAGLYVMCYTVDSDVQVAKKLLDSGVNTLCTNFVTEKMLQENEEKFGKHPFYIYYNSGNKDVICNYTEKEGSIIQELLNGNIEYKDREVWENNGKRALRKCQFKNKKKNFIGWHLRVKVDGKRYWYCKDYLYHTSGDFKQGTEPYLFSDEEVIPIWTVKKNMIMVMVAVWK